MERSGRRLRELLLLPHQVERAVIEWISKAFIRLKDKIESIGDSSRAGERTGDWVGRREGSMTD